MSGGWMAARRAGRALAPRTGRALAASLALAAIGMPAALLASQAPAAAAAGKRLAHSQVSLAITGMTPQQAGPGTTITVTGTVTNSSRQPISDLSVQLLASKTPVSTSAELRPGGTAQDGLASPPVQRGVWKSGGDLQPGSTDHWSVRVKANSIGMTRFGVYPLTARAQTASAPVALAATSTYLPYVPARKGPYGSSIPAPAKISWVLPLIDKPLLGPPWQGSCQDPQASALVKSLRSDGRLGQLLGAGAQSAGAVDAYSASAGSARTAQTGAVRSEQEQTLSGLDGVTWAVDPALLANVKALTGCGSTEPSWASAARSWLAKLRPVTRYEPMFLTPYGDPDVAALAATNLSPDVRRSIVLGQHIGQQILNRNDLGSPSATASSSGAQSQTAAIAWPAGGIRATTITPLAASGVRTLLLSQSALPEEKATVLRVPGEGRYMHVLLANESLSQLLAAHSGSVAATTEGSAFVTAQDFLAQTALAAEQEQSGQPLIVAPPQRWDPATGLAVELLAETASAPWLSPASLTSLTAGKHPTVLHPHWAASAARLRKEELGKLIQVDSGISELQSIAATAPSESFLLAPATIESSAWRGKPSRTARAMVMLKAVLNKISKQEHAVQIFAEPKVTLGGLKGSVPVSIDNGLGYAVKVQLRAQSQAPGVKVTAAPSGVVTVQAHNSMTVRVRVQATQVGSTTVTLSLFNQGGQRLPVSSSSMTVDATQVGVLFVIICAAALGVFLIAHAARVVRRGHPAADAGDPANPGPAADQDGDRSTDPAEPDTVMAERTELGTAGAPGP